MWYALDDETQTSTQLGAFNETSSDELKNAIENRNTRLFMVSEKESHAKNVLSVQTNAATIDYFDLTLDHDSGIPARSTQFVYRVILNGIAVLAMLGMVLSLATLFAFKTAENKKYAYQLPEKLPFNKKFYLIGALLTIVLTFYAIYRANAGNYSPFAPRPLADIFRVTVTGKISRSLLSISEPHP